MRVAQDSVTAELLSHRRSARRVPIGSPRCRQPQIVAQCRGRWTPTPPGKETEPGLIVYRLGADLFNANYNRFTDEVRTLVDHAPTSVHWFVVDAGPITNIDYSAAQSLRDLLDDLGHQEVGMVFARVRPSLRSDLDRHRVTAVIGERRIFAALREALAAVRGGAPGMPVDL
jgi:sulfate permease, SulP family